LVPWRPVLERRIGRGDFRHRLRLRHDRLELWPRAEGSRNWHVRCESRRRGCWVPRASRLRDVRPMRECARALRAGSTA
jgi:hypothetical protein